MCLKSADRMANNVDPDKTAPSVWSWWRSSLIRVYTVCPGLSVCPKTWGQVHLQSKFCREYTSFTRCDVQAVISNSNPPKGLFSRYLTTIKDSLNKVHFNRNFQNWLDVSSDCVDLDYLWIIFKSLCPCLLQGFEPRGTELSNRLTAYNNLISDPAVSQLPSDHAAVIQDIDHLVYHETVDNGSQDSRQEKRSKSGSGRKQQFFCDVPGKTYHKTKRNIQTPKHLL